MSDESKPLTGKIAVVVGATRASGRGIAVELGAAGATVYCTGRSVRGGASPSGAPETIDETSDMVASAGVVGIPVQVDHSIPAEVEALFERVRLEQNGRLDVLVNVIFSGGDPRELASWAEGLPLWETDLQGGLSLLERSVHTHIISNRFGLPLMAAHNAGLVVEVGDGISYRYRGENHGMFFYSLAKISLIHMAEALAADFRHKDLTGLTAVALTPGYLRAEAMLRGWKLTEEEWQHQATAKEIAEGRPAKSDGGCESPRYIGRAVVALATDPNVHSKSGMALSTGDLMREYGFTDIDGRQPYWDWNATHSS